MIYRTEWVVRRSSVRSNKGRFFHEKKNILKKTVIGFVITFVSIWLLTAVLNLSMDGDVIYLAVVLNLSLTVALLIFAISFYKEWKEERGNNEK